MSPRITVSPDLSHHLIDGKPLYSERFDEVMSFHYPPGLAAVRKGDLAYHIKTDGSPAYSRRFIRTFGFYDNLAAVVGPDGWFHIRPDGTDLYGERYAWAGNFQEELCPVRDSEGNYFHIDTQGRRVYSKNWRYAGDFRYGIAVVQREDGLYSHIDRTGKLLHHRWFLDLDVYHKGFARAKDSAGWTHIDLKGNPLYSRRFASVEPFYNGFSRVELFNGGIEIIDESGKTVHVLRDSIESEFYKLSDEITAYWRSLSILAAVKVGLFDHLPAKLTELSKKLSMPRENLRNLLRGMAKLDLAAEIDFQRWVPTSKGQLLKREHPYSLAPATEHFAEYCLPFWQELPKTLKKKEPRKSDIFTHLYRTSAGIRVNIKALESYAKFDYPKIANSLPLSDCKTVIDAGGGSGVLAQSIAREFPKLESIFVLERPEVVKLGVKNLPKELRERVQFVEGDLFGDWPVRGDAVVLARVLHDWDDERAAEILRRAGEALEPNGTLIILENLPPTGSFHTALLDLHLLAVNGGGRERTLLEFTELLESSGFSSINAIQLLPHLYLLTAKKRAPSQKSEE